MLSAVFCMIFILTGIESLLIYERKDKTLPFKIYKQEDLSLFSIDRIGQSKVSYKKTNKQINKK